MILPLLWRCFHDLIHYKIGVPSVAKLQRNICSNRNDPKRRCSGQGLQLDGHTTVKPTDEPVDSSILIALLDELQDHGYSHLCTPETKDGPYAKTRLLASSHFPQKSYKTYGVGAYLCEEQRNPPIHFINLSAFNSLNKKSPSSIGCLHTAHSLTH